jgi:2-polyprenyl-6-methoxyphenol hydroxylase-like FAD-dependent oxidoreductase
VIEPTGRVLVVGGGIAGLATAAALNRKGIATVVLERRDQALDAGLGINLPGNAVLALAALGLGEGLEQLGAPLRRREYRNRRGRLLFSVDEDAFWGLEARPRCVPRGELMALLRTAVPHGTVRLGAELQNMVEAQDRVAVELRDGTHEEGVLLVGADGVRSTVRSLVGVHQAPRAAVLSRSSWRFVTRNLGVDCWVVWSGGRDTVLFIPLGEERLYGWVSLGRDAASFAEVAAACDDFPRLVRNVLDAAASEPIAPLLSPLEEVRPAAWTPGRVVLVGDAAHATAPVWAQGAALAVEDALVLGEILAGTDVWNDAGHEFERRRRARVEHVQTMTDRFSHAARLPTWLRDRIVRVVGPRSYRATYEPLRAPVTSH